MTRKLTAQRPPIDVTCSRGRLPYCVYATEPNDPSGLSDAFAYSIVVQAAGNASVAAMPPTRRLTKRSTRYGTMPAAEPRIGARAPALPPGATPRQETNATPAMSAAGRRAARTSGWVRTKRMIRIGASQAASGTTQRPFATTRSMPPAASPANGRALALIRSSAAVRADRRPGGSIDDPTIRRMAKPPGTKLIVDNRRARYDYELLDRFEAGIVLTGTEVKSLRDGRATLGQAYVDVRDGEAWLLNASISTYDQGNIANHEPERPRKLLLHRRELETLVGKVRERGFTLVPTRLYFKDGRVKAELALARGKERQDKRRDIARREADRQIQRALKSRR